MGEVVAYLPMVVKIGLTLAVAFPAWLLQVRGFDYLTQGGGDVSKGRLYLLCGGLGWLAPIFFWWLGA